MSPPLKRGDIITARKFFFLLTLQPCQNVKNLREVYSGWPEIAIWSGGSLMIDNQVLQMTYQ